jgi:hypothetical protein
MSRPRLSVVMIAGAQRRRAQETADAIAAQTAAEAIELIVVDVRPDAARLRDSASLRATHILLPPATSWGAIRAAGVRAAASTVIAFIEDHCPPEPGWARALLEAHREPWAAVGYAFLAEGYPDWSSRASLIAEYGFWAHPAVGGPSRMLPGNNISYKRDFLLSLGDRLESALEIDNTIQRELTARGLRGAVEPRALVRHQELDGVWAAARANHDYSRLLAAARVHVDGWGWPRRIAYALMAPAAAPLLRVVRLARSLRGRRPLWTRALVAIPALSAIWSWAALGQSRGYLTGPGEAGRRMVRWELEAERVASSHS